MKKIYLCGQKMAIFALLLFTVAACNTNNSDADLNLTPINSQTVDGYTISLNAANPLATGANTLYWRVQKDGKDVDLKSMTIQPMMEMATMRHATPFRNPIVDEEDHSYFSNRAIFIMPSGDMGTWDIAFEIETKDQESIIGSMPIEVASSWRQTSVKNSDGAVYYITWLEPYQPVSGNNDLTFMIHTRESMHSFPPVPDAELIIYPFMDMGGRHGHSTDFNTPTAAKDGLYEGSINYSMSGDWTTSVQIVAEGDTLNEVVFTYPVQAK